MNIHLDKICIFLSILIASTLHGITIDIHNDSSYTLHAKVYDAEEEKMTEVVIFPDNSMKYQDSLFDAKDYAKGPFKVVFTCPNGSEYGTVSHIAQNFTVYARSARGPKKCHSDSQPSPHRDFDRTLPHQKH